MVVGCMVVHPLYTTRGMLMMMMEVVVLMICGDGCTPTRGMVMMICGVGHGCTTANVTYVCTGVQKRRCLPNGAIFICWQRANCAPKLPAPKAWMQVSGILVPPHLANLLRNRQLQQLQHLQLRQLNVFAVSRTLRQRCRAQQGIIFVNHAPTELLRILNLAKAMQ